MGAVTAAVVVALCKAVRAGGVAVVAGAAAGVAVAMAVGGAGESRPVEGGGS